MKSKKMLNILVLACLLASATAANGAAPRRLLSTRLRGGRAPHRRAFAFWKEKFWKKFPTTGAPGLGETLKNTASAYCDKFVEDSEDAAKPLTAKGKAINDQAAQLPTRPTPARFGECVGCGGRRALLSLEAPEAPEAPKEEEVTVATKTCTFNRPGSRHNAAPSWFASQPKYDGLHETCVAWFFTGDYIHDVQAVGATSDFCGCCHACDPFGHGHQYGTCNECPLAPEPQTPSPTPEPTPAPTPAPTPSPTPKPYSIISEVTNLRRQSLAVFTDPQLHWIRYDAPNQSGCGFAGCLCKPGSHSQEFDDVVIGVRDEVLSSLASKPLVCPVVQEAIHRIVAGAGSYGPNTGWKTNPDLSRPWIVGRGRRGDYPLPFCSNLKANGPGDGMPSYDEMAATACDNLGLAANDPLLTGRIKYEWLGRNKPGLDNHSGWMTTGKTCATRVADALLVTCVAAVGDRDRPEAQRAPLSTMTQEQMGAYISAWAGDRTLDCSY